MVNLKFSQTEKQALIQFHQLELIKAIETVEKIKERIRILTGHAKRGRRTKVQLAAAKPKRVRRTKAQLAAAIQKKQTTVRSHHKKVAAGTTKKPQHIQWKIFVPQLLKEKGAPMTAREIMNMAAKKFNISMERKKMKSLSEILRYMKKTGRVTSEEIKGSKQKIKQYSLVS